MICSKMNNKWWARCSDFLLLVLRFTCCLLEIVALSSSSVFAIQRTESTRLSGPVFNLHLMNDFELDVARANGAKTKAGMGRRKQFFFAFLFFSSFIQNEMLKQAPTEHSYLISHAIEKNEWEQIEEKEMNSIIVHWCVFCAFGWLPLCETLSLTHSRSLSLSRSQISNYK